MRQIKFRAWDAEKKCWFTDPHMLWRGLNTAISNIQANYNLCQFTGLLDKNGKEIFEGDIIRSEQWKPTTYQVAFDRGAFYIAGKDLHEVADIKYAEKFEVISNIYANPELLK